MQVQCKLILTTGSKGDLKKKKKLPKKLYHENLSSPCNITSTSCKYHTTLYLRQFESYKDSSF